MGNIVNPAFGKSEKATRDLIQKSKEAIKILKKETPPLPDDTAENDGRELLTDSKKEGGKK